ncbi:RNA polymerase sigma factor SigF [Streptomyces sp. AM 4-1-1]|uniref:RNA polymerase sigma factor SigF n=1 Tax=Streptomyces sp. AM 4-1-1 TaxID=3028710 RepID=UPI0023B9AE40|nr:RNA polymerase sigma factor SigF [Streptomyces sp. AM 4-1-1]WEH34446.1 RNA polymerase sigma factor SigF [Streptomyces sp. AM 4-1-1]
MPPQHTEPTPSPEPAKPAAHTEATVSTAPAEAPVSAPAPASAPASASASASAETVTLTENARTARTARFTRASQPAQPAQVVQPVQPAQAARTAEPVGLVETETPDSGGDRVRTRGADTRALTQVLFGRLKDLEPGTPEHGRVRAALIEANLPLVRYAAARFRSRNEPMEDVVQVGTIGLINAIDRFDPERGVQFPTFAMPTVVGEIKRYFRDNVRTVHVPRRLHELWVQVTGATEDLTTAHGRSPTTAEIAERLRISEDEVLACIEAGRSYHATSLEAAQEGDGLPGLLDRLGYEDPALAGVEHRDLVRHLLVQLPEREQRILLLRYYSNLTQSQISAELGVSQMHVSRLLARSFARLRSANRIEA